MLGLEYPGEDGSSLTALLGSTPCSSRSSWSTDDPSSPTHRQSTRSLVVNTSQGKNENSRYTKAAHCAAYSLTKLDNAGWPYGPYLAPYRKEEKGRRRIDEMDRMKRRWERAHSAQVVVQGRYKLRPSAWHSEEWRGKNTCDRSSVKGPRQPTMRPSTSTSSGLYTRDGKYAPPTAIYEKECVGDGHASSPLMPAEGKVKTPISLRVQLGDTEGTVEGWHEMNQAAGSDNAGWMRWCSLPSSSSLSLPQAVPDCGGSLPALSSRAESRTVSLGGGPDDFAGNVSTVTSSTPLDPEHVPVQTSNAIICNTTGGSIGQGVCPTVGSAIRARPASAHVRNGPVLHEAKPQVSLKQSRFRLAKHKAPSFVTGSQTVVSRWQSQQWLGSSMPAPTTAAASVASSGPTQTDPSPADHRNVLTAAPCPTAGTLQNPLYNVSNEFMRVAGYTQQFRRLLSKGPSVKETCNECGAVTIEEKDLEKGQLTMPIGVVIPADYGEPVAAAAVAAGGMVASPGIAITVPPKDPNGDIVRPVLDPRRQSRKSAYGRLWKEQPNFKHRLKKRKQLLSRRTTVSDFALIFALGGIILTVLEAELTASRTVDKAESVSILLRALIVITTMVLLSLVICYHAIETKIAVIDSGAEDWRVAITYDRIWHCALEVAVCSICPFPANVYVKWDRLMSDHRTPYRVWVPLDAVLSVPMFLRFYLFGRFMALHSRQFQDAATRSIAALNHIAVNFTFVLKTLMYEHPLRVLILFTVAFWVAMSWILTQCERFVSGDPTLEPAENNHYLNSIWFIIITFMSIGYGDIVPNTYCGRALAITTGIVGAGVSSALIAVISRKLELSRAEKHVNQFMTDSKLMRQRKEAAAAVLQHTWFIHKYKNIPKAKDDMKVRMHQRRFLAAINEFRRVKWDQRKLAEQGNALVDVAKLQSEMHETLWDMQQNQDHMVTQMAALVQKVQELQELIVTTQRQSSVQVQPCQELQQTPRKVVTGILTRQLSMHSAPFPDAPAGYSQTMRRAPIVIAHNIENFHGTTPNASFDDETGRSVVL